MKTTLFTGAQIVTALAGLLAGCSAREVPAAGPTTVVDVSSEATARARATTPAPTSPTTEGDVKCGGINSCAGMGSCSTHGHACAGQNKCKGLGWVKTPTAAECTGKGGKVL